MNIPAFLTNPNARSLALAAGLFSAAMLSAAFVAQYGFGLHPCHLCLVQRYPYAAIIVIGFVAWGSKSEKILFMLAFAAGLLLVADAGIAFYHSGVELGIFPGPSGCTNTESGGQTLEEMRAAIMNAPLVPCDQAMVKILGLSLASWNAIAAAAAAAALFFQLKKLRRA